MLIVRVHYIGDKLFIFVVMYAISPTVPASAAANTNGGELFEKFQRQKLNRENGNINGNR